MSRSTYPGSMRSPAFITYFHIFFNRLGNRKPCFYYLFSNFLQSSWECHLPRSTYSGAMNSPALPLGSLGPRWIKDAPNQLLGLGRNIISITAVILIGHCVMGRHAERMQLPSNDFYRGYRSVEEDTTYPLSCEVQI